MPPTFAPIVGAQGYQQSNPSVLCIASLLGSLRVFKDAGMMPAVRTRSMHLTGRLYAGLFALGSYWSHEGVSRDDDKREKEILKKKVGFTIITPEEPGARGAQLSLVVLPTGRGYMPRVYDGLKKYGVVGDERQPDVIRLAPVALYNTEEEVEKAVVVFGRVIEEVAADLS